jgi:hypothetical protein
MARSAAIVTRGAGPAQIFGTVSMRARTEVDKESRLVSFEDIEITDASFPSSPSLRGTLMKAVRESAAYWPRTVSLDRLLADLDITQSEVKTESIALKNDPPEIIWSKSPAALILIDSQPVYRPVPGTRYSRVVNTPALLLFDSAAGTFYLDGGGCWWMTATSLNGPWTAATNPPGELDAIKQQFTKDEEKEPGTKASPASSAPPAVYVSTAPAELVTTQGEPVYSPIPNTNLLYVRNSGNDIFMEVKSQQYYLLLAGRWFMAKSLNGPWAWMPGERSPGDFKRISPTGPKGNVLASVPGTEQAREAVIANQIPETATVRRSEAKLEVSYFGDPAFEPIEGTTLGYAVNTSSEVIRADGGYYSALHGVWFVAPGPLGPWVVADTIPAAIYTIPPSSPLFHLRYVYVYGATPDFVYVGYMPGYVGAFVSDSVVVFGTGWWYPGTLCGDFWCGWPWTWGLGFEFSYWGGGWFWFPAHHYWWYHPTPFTHRIFAEHWNPQVTAANREWVRGNVNAYSHWAGNAVVARNIASRGASAHAAATRPDLYAGQDGQIYQRRTDGWYRQNGAGSWEKLPANSKLDQQRDSRSLGQTRQQEFERRGQSPGIPRTVAPPRTMSPPRSAGGRGRGR